MRKIVPALYLLVLPAAAQIPPGYYDAAQGLTGEPLRQALNTIIGPHTVLQFTALWAAFERTDRKPNNTVWDIYSDIPGGSPAYTFQFELNQCGNYNGEGDCYTREHSFPQSWFGYMLPMRSDLHHVYPTDGWVTNQRGNWPFGTTSAPAYTSINGTQRGPCDWPDCTGTVWEPIDAYKGDVARSQFYMLTCYLNESGSWTSPVLSGNHFVPWQESLLLAWHLQDPVSAKEIARNDSIYVVQGNRNPYIDHPEWVQYIWGPTAGLQESSTSAVRIATTTGHWQLWWGAGEMTAELAIRDVAGRVIAQHPRIGQGALVPMPAIPGIYLLTITCADKRLSIRTVVP